MQLIIDLKKIGKIFEFLLYQQSGKMNSENEGKHKKFATLNSVRTACKLFPYSER